MSVAVIDLSPHTEVSATDAESVHDLLRHYARRRRVDRDVLSGLEAAHGDLQALLCEGLLARATESGDVHRFLVRALPELWWIDLEMGLDALSLVGARLLGPALERLRRDAATLVFHFDRGERPRAWQGAPELFVMLTGDSEDDDEALELRPRLLARGLGLALAMGPEWPGLGLEAIDTEASLGLLRAIVRDGRLQSDERWLGALLLRGGPRSVAVATASLLFAPEKALTRIRDLLAMAPPSSMVRVAEAHGLLTLSGEDGLETAEALRTALLTQAWQGADLSTLEWWRAFRGEQIVLRSLPELGDAADELARGVVAGLPHLVVGDGLADPARRGALAGCLAHVLEGESGYTASFRIAESRIRDLGRSDGYRATAPALRAYASLLVATARLLLRRERGRDGALKLYGRVLRLRRAHPDLLPMDVFPDTLDAAISVGDPDRMARRWLAREAHEPVDPRLDAPDAFEAGPTHDAPLAFADETVTAADGLAPLPGDLASWIGAGRRSVLERLARLAPLPYRYLLGVARRWLGSAPRARFVLKGDGHTAVVVKHRTLGIPVGSTRFDVPGGTLLPFPEGSVKADRMLGRWTALLLVTATIGTLLVLRGLQSDAPVGVLTGAGLLLGGLTGYFGALRLHRLVSDGRAVAVSDERGRVQVWRIDPATRHMLVRPPEQVVEAMPVSRI